jgi:hypothetical protein
MIKDPHKAKEDMEVVVVAVDPTHTGEIDSNEEARINHIMELQAKAGVDLENNGPRNTWKRGNGSQRQQYKSNSREYQDKSANPL